MMKEMNQTAQIEIDNDRINKGFTLIETVVAIAVLGIMFLMLVVIFSSVTNLVGEARARSVAVVLANEKMEVARNLSYNNLGTVGGVVAGVLPQEEEVEWGGNSFRVETSVIYVDDDYDGVVPDDPIGTDYKRVRIKVTWGGAFASKTPVQLVSHVAPIGLESGNGGGTMVISVINAMGEGVEGAQVRLVNTQVDPVIDTEIESGSDGKIMIPGAPACTNCYELNVTKDGFTSARTYSTEELANPLNPHLSVLEGEVAAMTLSIDRVSQITARLTRSRENNYTPFQGVEFILRGSKQLGTNDLDEPIYKFEQNFVSGTLGLVTISNLEWDTYEIIMPTGSSVDFAGSLPISPFSLSPGENKNIAVVTAAATSNSLLAIVQDIGSVPVASASVSLVRNNEFIATKSAGLASFGDMGQVLFPNLIPDVYGIVVSQIGFQEASSAATVVGDIKEFVVLEHE